MRFVHTRCVEEKSMTSKLGAARHKGCTGYSEIRRVNKVTRERARLDAVDMGYSE